MTAKTGTSSRKIHVTCALPYANGPIHLGHMLEHIQGDIFSRFLKMSGNECYFVCADDTHGTPIMIAAKKAGITPEEFIKKSFDSHTADFKDFMIGYDEYSSTHSENNKSLSELFYNRMKAKGDVHKKPIDQLYCEHDKMFLPDRFVKGTCPKCKSKDQYGDSCDVCGATYAPEDMSDAACSLCGTKPIKKASDHIFFKLNNFKSYLQEWLPGHTADDVAKKMMEWFKEDLRDWDISRDAPYFGFPIPGEDQKYFYVWVDAPMGYISTLKQHFDKLGKDIQEIWAPDAKSEIYHFIGKDIVYFHTLFWPALLKSADFKSPTKVNVHGHVMVNGEKMSKSKGTFITARTYLNHLNPEYLRYYYATKLSGTADDLDLNLQDFTNRVNSDLVGKIVNLASRGAQMLNKKFDSQMTECDPQGLELVKSLAAKESELAGYFESLQYSKATTLIRELAESVNKYFDEKAPWKMKDEEANEIKKILTTTLNAYRILAIYLSPILPDLSAKTAKLFGEKSYQWSDAQKVLTNYKINAYEHIAQRVDADKVKAMVEEQKAFFASQAPAAKPAAAASKSAAKADIGPGAEIEFEDFAKIDLRIAKVIEAEEIKEADKLLRLKVELDNGQTKQIIAGIKSAYSAEKLLGRQVLICANLKPRKMKFGMSEGMVLAAGDGGADLFVLSPDEGAKTGSKVK